MSAFITSTFKPFIDGTNSFDGTEVNTATLLAIMGGVWLICVLIITLQVIANWRIFEKAGQPGWKALVPYYNTFTLCKISWGDGMYFLLYFLPGVSGIISIITTVKIAKAFHCETGFTIGLIFLPTIFSLILGFDSTHQYDKISNS